jgi:hypothetical protein
MIIVMKEVGFPGYLCGNNPTQSQQVIKTFM